MLERIAEGRAELWHYPLSQPVGGSGLQEVKIVVVEIELSNGLKGLGLSYILTGAAEPALTAAQHILNNTIIGSNFVHPLAMWRKLHKSLNRVGKGPNYIAYAAIDTCLWDLYGKFLDLPSGLAMGGEPCTIPVYGSGNFHAHQLPEEAAQAASDYAQQGVKAVKLRVSGQLKDAEVLHAVREALPADVFIMLDANERCDLCRAQWLVEESAKAGVLFVEEPLAADNVDGYRKLAAASPVAIATGEHLQGGKQGAVFVKEGLCSVIQPDLAMMGGLTECWRLTQLAEHCGIDVAPHFLPSIFIHLAAASPNLTWLEHFPLLEPLFKEPLVMDEHGNMSLPETPGIGIEWADGAREEFLVHMH